MGGIDEQRLYHQVGNRIRKARERTTPRLSQAQLAERLGVNRVSIVNIEAGKQRAPLYLLWRIAQEVGSELALLIPRHDEFIRFPERILDPATVASINAVADGDAETRRLLADFVAKVQARKPDGPFTLDLCEPQALDETVIPGALGTLDHDAL